ncbi:hypothetical protein IPU75_05170 [Ochrobactrum sp. SD129]|nr:hypothetical protein [Ochrobactrum sp. SD129]
MANRYERRRAAKVLKVEKVSHSELMSYPSLCAWNGCGSSTHSPDDNGWSKLLLYKGKTQLNFVKIPPKDMARDAVLCPEHAHYLHQNVLVNIGDYLNETIGTA